MKYQKPSEKPKDKWGKRKQKTIRSSFSEKNVTEGEPNNNLTIIAYYIVFLTLHF